MLFLSDNTQAGVIDAFGSTSIYLDDLLYIDNPYFEKMIYHNELQLDKEKSFDTKAPPPFWTWT